MNLENEFGLKKLVILMILVDKSEPKILFNNIEMLDEIASIDLCGVAFYMNIH